MATTTVTAEATKDRIGLDTAYRVLWLAVVFDILAFGVGLGWDRTWARDASVALLTRTTDFVPLIVPALVLAVRGSAAIGWRGWTLTGLCFGGAVVAGRIWRVAERPTRRGVLTFVALAGVAAPAFTGVIDLALRVRTP